MAEYSEATLNFFKEQGIEDSESIRFILHVVSLVKENNIAMWSLKANKRLLSKTESDLVGYLLLYGFRPKDIASCLDISIQAVNKKIRSIQYTTLREYVMALAMEVYSALTINGAVRSTDGSAVEIQFRECLKKLPEQQRNTLYENQLEMRKVLLTVERLVTRLQKFDELSNIAQEKLREKSADSYTVEELLKAFERADRAQQMLYDGDTDLYTDKGMKEQAGLTQSVDDSKLYYSTIKKIEENNIALEHGLDEINNSEEISQDDINSLTK